MLTDTATPFVPVPPGSIGFTPDAAVPSFRLDTIQWPNHSQYTGWVESVGDIVEIIPDADLERGFTAELDAWDLGGILLVHSRLPRLAYRRSLRQCRTDGLDHWVLAATRHSGTAVLGVACLSQSISGRLDCSEAVHLCIPRDFLRQSALEMDRLNGEVVRTTLGRLLAEFLLNLAIRMPELEPADYPGLRSSIHAMIEGCIMSPRLGLQPEIQPVQATILEKARRMVQQRLSSPTLSVDELCRDLAVSRSRLYRLFEPLGGVVHYIRHRRLLDAHAALADAEDRRPIVAIAAERGFIDPAEFSRAFKREFGYRPSDARASIQSLPFRRQSTGETLAELLHKLG
jgi:AraC-like DNA-binding protein